MTTVSVVVFLVMVSLNRPNSVGGGGNCNSLSLKSLGSGFFSCCAIEDEDRRGGGGGDGDDGGDG